MKARLLTPLRSVARDLVDKRLWPIAILLLAALVAVPLLIGSGSSDAPQPAPAATVKPATQDAAGSIVKVVGPAVTGKDDRPGKLDDPFYDPPEPETAKSSSAATSTATKSTESTAAPASGAKEPATPPTPPADKPQADPDPQPQPLAPKVEATYYRTEVRVYETDRSKRRAITRLSPLRDPSGPSGPVAVYLGVAAGGDYAIFLLAPNTTSRGEAECGEDCRIIGLKAGRSQVIDVRLGDGGTRRLHLDVVSVKRVEADSEAAAARARRHEHPDGREALIEMIQDRPTAEAIGPLRYDSTLGVITLAASPAAKVAP